MSGNSTTDPADLVACHHFLISLNNASLGIQGHIELLETDPDPDDAPLWADVAAAWQLLPEIIDVGLHGGFITPATAARIAAHDLAALVATNQTLREAWWAILDTVDGRARHDLAAWLGSHGDRAVEEFPVLQALLASVTGATGGSTAAHAFAGIYRSARAEAEAASLSTRTDRADPPILCAKAGW